MLYMSYIKYDMRMSDVECRILRFVNCSGSVGNQNEKGVVAN